MGQLTGHTVTWTALFAAPAAPPILLGKSTGQHGPVGVEALSGHLQPELVEAAKSGQVSAGEARPTGSVRHVEVFRMVGVRTPIIGRPRPLSRQRRADHHYTLICEEPDNPAQGALLKSARERMNIISAYHQVGSHRGAAELCGTTHKTVKRVVERAEGAGPPPPDSRPRNTDAFTELVAARVRKSRGKMSAKRMLPIARAAGYQGSTRNFRRLASEQKVLWRNANRYERRPAVWSPGEYLVMDWAQAAPGLMVFCAVLAYSRWLFVRFAADEKGLHHVGDDRRAS